jgi:hypothetical protein
MLVGGLAALLAAGASAQGTAVPLDRLMACARIDDDRERLACFDGEVASRSLEAKRLAGERAEAAKVREAEAAAAAAAAAKAAEAEKKQRFGGEALGEGPEGRVESIDAAIVETFLDRAKLLVFLLDNGHVWRQTDGIFKTLLKPGEKVVVKRSRLGGYMLEIPARGRSVPVRRIR